MRYAVTLPNGGEWGDPRFLLELAERAEASGWDGVFLEDYVSYQGDPDAPTSDVWTTLGAIAVRTQRVILGTSLTPMPRRRPWNVAREAAAIDQLSSGRFVLGVGLGDAGEHVVVDASLSHFGEVIDRRTRAEMLDESLAIVHGLWRGKPFHFHREHYEIDEVTFLPRPVQQPRIPIWVGGGYPLPSPTRRALRWDGSLLYKLAPAADGRMVASTMTADDIRALAEWPEIDPSTFRWAVGRATPTPTRRASTSARWQRRARPGQRNGFRLPIGTRCGDRSNAARFAQRESSYRLGPGVDAQLGRLGLGGPSLDCFGQEDHELGSVSHRKLKGADATIALPQAHHHRLGLGVPCRFQGAPPRINEPPTARAWQVDEIAHVASVRANDPRVNAQ